MGPPCCTTDLAARHADRIVVFVDGALRADGSPAAVLTTKIMQHCFGVRTSVHPHPADGRPYVLPA